MIAEKRVARPSLALLLAIAFASSFQPITPIAVAETTADATISDDARAALARMNKTLLAKQFSFQARTLRSYAGPNGELLHIVHKLKTVFRRPDRLFVEVSGDDGDSEMIYDGKTIVLFAVDDKQYASLPVVGDIDKALDAVEERTGADFPLADLLSDDPAQSVLAGVTSGRQVGTSTIGGVRCRHFFFVQAPDMEFELWLEDDERALPRRFVVTYRSLPGRPILVAELSDWNFSIEPPDSAFAFAPPAGVRKVELTSKASPTRPSSN